MQHWNLELRGGTVYNLSLPFGKIAIDLGLVVRFSSCTLNMVLKPNLNLMVKESLSQNWRTKNLLNSLYWLAVKLEFKVHVNPRLAQLGFNNWAPQSSHKLTPQVNLIMRSEHLDPESFIECIVQTYTVILILTEVERVTTTSVCPLSWVLFNMVDTNVPLKDQWQTNWMLCQLIYQDPLAPSLHPHNLVSN